MSIPKKNNNQTDHTEMIADCQSAEGIRQNKDVVIIYPYIATIRTGQLIIIMKRCMHLTSRSSLKHNVLVLNAIVLGTRSP